MESSTSDSENECFESAEESLDENENDDINTKSSSLQECENELPEYVPSRSDSVKPLHQENEEVPGNLMSYRKRPERVKRLNSKPSNKTTSKSPSEPIFKSDKIVSDVLLQDITSNLTKNINRSLTTLQQTSSNVKELFFNTIPLPSHNNNKTFTYDDKSVFSTAADNFLDNKHFESEGKVGDHLTKKEEINHDTISTKEVSFLLVDRKNDIVEGRKLSSTDTYNMENKVNELLKFDSELAVIESTFKKEHNSEEQQNLEKPDNTYLSNDYTDKGTEDNSEYKTGTEIDEVEKSMEPHEGFINNENAEILKPGDGEDASNTENSITKVVEHSHNGNTETVQLDIKKEMDHFNELKIDKKEPEGEENPENKKLVSCAINDNSCIVPKNLTSPSADVENTENLEIITEKDVNIPKEKLESDSECNLKELKTALKNIINEEKGDLENTNENSNEDFAEELIFQGKMVGNETSDEGWDDFDFSEPEDENMSFKQDMKSSNNNFKDSKCADYFPRNEALKTVSTKPSFEAVSGKSNVEKLNKQSKSLAVENIKNEIIEIKSVAQDVWDWDAWDEGSENSKEMAVGSETKTSDLKKAEDDPLDISKWSQWDKFGQKLEEKPRNWSLGSWGVDMLLNKATTVTQGISSVLEAGLGAPDPETLARMEKMERENMKGPIREEAEAEKPPLEISKKNSLTNVNLFPVSGITSLVAEVTSKIVEHSKIQEIGSKVISGGLDTLETFGKKTMEVLQEGDPGLKNKRALLLGDKKPVLSQVLREAREKADRELKKVEERELAKKCHFETLFDDFQGMVHLEALEMLSRQYELKLEQLRSGMNSEEQEDINSILEEVEQLCSLDEFDMNLKNSKLDFKIKLQMAVEPLKNEISIQKIILIHEEINNWLQRAETISSLNVMNQKLVSTLAELAAATVQQFHKSGELLSVKECRKTVEEVDALLRLTNVLCAEIDTLCEKFILFFKERSNGVDNEKINSIIENLTKIRTNSTSYIRQAFNLLIPVLQFGAAVY